MRKRFTHIRDFMEVTSPETPNFRTRRMKVVSVFRREK